MRLRFFRPKPPHLEQQKCAGDGATKASKLEDKHASGYDFPLINNDIEDPLFADVVKCVSNDKKNESLVFIQTLPKTLRPLHPFSARCKCC
jgi:hypothetical protein